MGRDGAQKGDEGSGGQAWVAWEGGVSTVGSPGLLGRGIPCADVSAPRP